MEIFELVVVGRFTRPAGDELMDENGGGPLARQIDVPATQGPANSQQTQPSAFGLKRAPGSDRRTLIKAQLASVRRRASVGFRQQAAIDCTPQTAYKICTLDSAVLMTAQAARLWLAF